MKLWVDSALLIDEWTSLSATALSATVRPGLRFESYELRFTICGVHPERAMERVNGTFALMNVHSPPTLQNTDPIPVRGRDLYSPASY